MPRPPCSGVPLRPTLALAALPLLLAACWNRDYSIYQHVVPILPGPAAVFDIKEAFITAKPGTVIELPAGTFELDEELSIGVPHVLIRGQGMDETILSFKTQEHGAQGIIATADEFAIEDLSILDPPGDGIRVQGAKGVLFRRVRVEWTGGPSTSNGAYGLYPVFTRDVLIEGCVVKGASDAGIYVGQSYDIVVRGNRVEFNVAGIEIENTQNADVYENVATNNTGGILVFDLPGNTPQGRRNRVFDNEIFENNTSNFAPPGNIVGNVPGGTGVLVMANKDVEIFGNHIHDNISTNLAIVSYLILFEGNPDPQNYDPYPERIHVHDNRFARGGTNPQPALASLSWAYFMPDPLPDVLWDGFQNPANLVNGSLPPDLKICIRNNQFDDDGGAAFGNMRAFLFSRAFTNLAPHDCAHAPLALALIDPQPPIPASEDDFTEEEIAALCGASGPGVNRGALVVACPELSDYRLFEGGDPRGTPRDGGVPFDLTTPLFSDYAHKVRVLFLPPGQSATYDPDDAFDLPVGTVIAKTFTFRRDLRDPSLGEEVVETRLLIHRASGWVGLAYIWEQDLSEAFLSIGGGARTVDWIHTDGTPRSTRYQIPNVNQCGRCHFRSGGGGAIPIGPKARLLNRDYPYPEGTENQLTHLSRLRLLSGAPAPGLAPRLPVWSDPADGTLEERARAYLESNCAHCHSSSGGAAFSGLFLDASQELNRNYGVCKTPSAAGIGSGTLLYDLVPGNPAESVLLFRLNSAEPAIRMPELSKSVVHDEAVALVSSWIASLPPVACP